MAKVSLVTAKAETGFHSGDTSLRNETRPGPAQLAGAVVYTGYISSEG